MKYGVDQDQDLRDGRDGGRIRGSSVEGGTRVRLSWLTWEGLACVVVLVTLCIVFGGDGPVDEAGAITLKGHSGLVETVRFSPDGDTLVTACWDRTVKLWDVGDGPLGPGQELASLPGTSEMYSAVFSPDGGTVAATGLHGLTIWSWRDTRSLPETNTKFGPCRAVAFAHDGCSLAMGGFDKKIRIWDWKTDRVLAVLSGHHNVVHTLMFTPDGSLLMSLDFDGVLKFWDLRTYREVDRLAGINEQVHAVSLSQDGRTVALSRLGSLNRQIEVWDLESNKLRAICRGHGEEVHTLGFSPDSRTLVSAGGDQALRFWDSETGEPRGKFEQGVGWIRSIDISRDGRWLACTGADSKVYLKRIDLPVVPVPARKAS